MHRFTTFYLRVLIHRHSSSFQWSLLQHWEEVKKYTQPQLHWKCQMDAQIYTLAKACESCHPTTSSPFLVLQTLLFRFPHPTKSRLYKCGPVPVPSIHLSTYSTNIYVPVTVLNTLKTLASKQTKLPPFRRAGNRQKQSVWWMSCQEGAKACWQQ